MQTKIAVIGINHKRAPVEIRERFSLSQTEQKLLLSELKNRPDVIEAFVLSTCNRVEIYANLLNKSQNPYFLLDIVCKIKNIPSFEKFRQYFYCHTDDNAARHLFRVTSGLDSLIVGERQILGQVKDAVAQAAEACLLQKKFNILTNLAIWAGKKAQTQTDISTGGSSVGWAAVIQAEKSLGSLQNKTALVIGAGKMSRLALKQMSEKGLEKIYLINRTHEKALPLAENYKAQLTSLYDLKDVLTKTDVCISAVAAPHYIVGPDLLKSVMNARPDRPLTIIDIAVPRNVDPVCAQVAGIQLYTVDHLENVISQTLAKRQAAIADVERIIEQKLAGFYDKVQKIKDFDNGLKLTP